MSKLQAKSPGASRRSSSTTRAAKITAWYVVAGTAWIVASDMAAFGVRPRHEVVMSVAKGLAFVYATATLLFLTLKRHYAKLELAYAAILESRGQYESLFTNCRVPMFLVDPATNAIVDANVAAAKRYGYSREELLALKVGDINPASSEEIAEKMREVMEEVSTVRLVVKHRTKSGELRDVEVFSGGIPYGGRTLVLSVAVDVTEREEAEGLARSQGALLKAIAEASPDGMLATGENGRWTFWNDRFQELWRVDPRDSCASGEAPTDSRPLQPILKALANPEGFAAALRDAEAEAESRRSGQERLRDGRWIEWACAPIDSGEESRGRAWFFHDVTEMAVLQERLKLMVDRMSRLVNAAPLAVFTLDPQGRVTTWNKEAERIFGWSEEETRGKPLPIVQEAKRHEFRALLARVLGGEELRGVRLVRRRRSGEEFPLSLCSAPLRDAKGRIEGVLSMLEDLTEREAMERRAISLATTDTLTGLLNRNSFLSMLESTAGEGTAKGERFAVLHLDLDGFKDMNESLGHETGDRLLAALAERLRSRVRVGDALARIGGDEFAILHRQSRGRVDGERIAKRVLAAFDKPFAVDGRELTLSACVGLAFFPDDGSGADALQQCAASALAESKRRGRRCWTAFSSKITDENRRRHEIEMSLHRSLEREELRLVYQPQVRLDNLMTVGVEALLRWRHPILGEVSPSEFVHIAEGAGLIRPIGAWALDRACALCRRLESEGRGVRVAVNISFAQFADPNFIDMARLALARSGAAPELIELELTESTLATDANKAIETVAALKDLGLKLAIDDFGAGYSSLAYLKRFRVDRLKIDQSFVRDLMEDDGAKAIVRASIGLGHSLGMVVVAEGVETEEQADFLREAECDEAQGFLYSRPAAIEDIGWRRGGESGVGAGS